MCLVKQLVSLWFPPLISFSNKEKGGNNEENTSLLVLSTTKCMSCMKCKLKIVCNCCYNAVPSKVCCVGLAVKIVVLC